MHRNNKNGQSLPINAIIIAALAMIVLVVVTAIFTGRARIFAKDLESCETKQGKCVPKSTGCTSNQAKVTNVKCEKKDDICCITVLNE